MTATRRPHILLVDASPYIFRGHFALPSSIVDREGRASNAVYGFGSFLLKLLADEGPTHLGVVFDHSLTTSFRNEIYPDYKRQREPPPVDLEAQVEDCRELAASFGAAVFVDELYEADDLIATLCERVRAEDDRAAVAVVTPDKDLSQLVRKGVEWFDYGKSRRYRADDVRARFGVEPSRLPDLLGLAGDAVDNIPGVPGIGSKTALALLEHFTSVERLVERAAEIADLPLRGAARLANLLAEHGELALLSKRLATVVRDIPMTTSLADLVLSPPRRSAIDRLFERLGFDSLRDRALARIEPC